MKPIQRQLSKKDKHKKRKDDEGHYEGKYWCNCRMRNIRKWLGKKRYGITVDILNP